MCLVGRLTLLNQSVKFFRSLRSRTYPLLYHFQNDGTTVECSSTSPDPVSNSMLLELKGWEKEWWKRYRRVLVKRMFVVGPHWSNGEVSLRLAPALTTP